LTDGVVPRVSTSFVLYLKMPVVIHHFWDTDGTGTLTYLVHDLETKKAAIIDPLLDFDIKACRSTTRSADAVLAKVAEHKLEVQWILESHVHVRVVCVFDRAFNDVVIIVYTCFYYVQYTT
jgi:glyoxylase-like metal-dependent hydrolase (beta-lactamase superfamily II)